MNNLYRIDDIKANLNVARFQPLDILVVGGTGAGKSSTINAVFEKEMSKIGYGSDPETMSVSSAMLNDLMRFWDSPGLGDNIDNDKKYAKELVKLLYEDYFLDNERFGLIDTVLVILDGSTRDMGTAYKILNEIVVPNFQIDRVLVAINQADLAMKGMHWDENSNQPDEILLEFLDKKSTSVSDRIMEATGFKVSKPIYYSAEKGYNIKKVLDMIIDNMPRERRKFVF